MKDDNLNRSISNVAFYSSLLMTLTIVHHVYGAIVYNTPWRTYVALVTIPVIIFTTIVSKTINKHYDYKKLLLWIFCGVTLIVPVIAIGLFEGFYNHLLKNILFFAGTGYSTMQRMFPPPKYEMPSDFFFEFTGICQAIVAVPLIICFVQLTKSIIQDMKRRIIQNV
jgi:hypothetical protein